MGSFASGLWLGLAPRYWKEGSRSIETPGGLCSDRRAGTVLIGNPPYQPLSLSVPAQVSVLASSFRPWNVMESALTGFLLDTVGLVVLLCLAHFLNASFKFTEDGLNWKVLPVRGAP